LCAATALAGAMSSMVGALPAVSQELGALVGQDIPADAQLLLEADLLTYDNDLDTVTASGGVRIEYGGNRLVANQVTYNRQTGRLVARGGVELIEPGGLRFTADEIDITDDFAEGFVNALRVETVNKTYFAAESADRKGDRVTVFNNGVYTACAPCEERPDRAPIWRIKATRTIWDQKEKTVRFENSRFELFGLPIAYLPVFEIPDPTVERKSGFLVPSVRISDELGVGIRVPYYFALSPTYDLTLAGTYYTKQGFLAEAEWRQRFNNGMYTITVAGIVQQEPEAFDLNTVDRGPDGDLNEERGMVGTKGEFLINPRWTFGWNLLAQSDKNFSHTYGIAGFTDYVHRDEVYLVGLHDRNFFDLRGMHFRIQEEVRDEFDSARDEEQPFVLPSLDYSVIPDEPVFGGELSIDVNARSLYREELDAFNFDPLDPDPERDPFVRGLDGSNGRVTGETEWRRSLVMAGGVVVTPLLHFQADAGYTDTSNEGEDRLNDLAVRLNGSPFYTGDTVEADVLSSFNRYMATLGLELRWPVLFSSTSATHVLEPMAQVFARPDEPYVEDRLGIPNEDAQSFVFDATTLFERDKFAGYDRIEGGTRANLGLRYSGSFANGWTANALVGQSYHLAGLNSFDQPDLVNVGAYSGLESDVSDFVALTGFATPFGFSMSASGRFDEESFELRRGEVKAAYTRDAVSVSGLYAYIQAQPLYGFDEDRHEVRTNASLRFAENWRVFGGATYDLENEFLVSDRIGLGYDDECFSYTLSFAETRDDENDEAERTIGFSVSLRTLGDFGTDQSLTR
jgi:LPS-assembly protein